MNMLSETRMSSQTRVRGSLQGERGLCRYLVDWFYRVCLPTYCAVTWYIPSYDQVLLILHKIPSKQQLLVLSPMILLEKNVNNQLLLDIRRSAVTGIIT